MFKEFYAVIPPGKDPGTIPIESAVTQLGWKFAAMSDGELIDLVGAVDRELKELTKWSKAAHELLKNRIPLPADTGEKTVVATHNYVATISKGTRTDIDRDAVRRDMGDEWYVAHCVSTPTFTLKITPVKE